MNESRPLLDPRSMSKPTRCPAETENEYMSTSKAVGLIAPLTVFPTDVLIASLIWSFESGMYSISESVLSRLFDEYGSEGDPAEITTSANT